MRPIILIVLVLTARLSGAADKPTAFVHANVVPMDVESVLPDHTVIVADGRILAVGPSSTTPVPPQMHTIDAQGAWLMPGMADMHAHLSSFDQRPEHLALYLAEGVTTVRTMSGEPLNLDWRRRIAAGELVGPMIYTSGPTLFGLYGDELGLQVWADGLRVGTALLPLVCAGLLYLAIYQVRRFQGWREGLPPSATPLLSRRAQLSSVVALLFLGGVLGGIRIVPVSILARALYDAEWGWVVETPQQAVDQVRQQQERGYDFIKVYDGLTEEQYQAAVNEARRLGMYTAGHAPNQIGLETIAKAGQAELAHMDELLSYHWIGYDPAAVDSSLQVAGFPVDYETIPRTAALLREHQMGVVATLVVDEVMYRLCLDTPSVLAGPEYRVVPPAHLEDWRRSGRNVRAFRDQGPYRRDIGQPFLQELTRALHAAGVLITTGVDAGVEGMIPGYHIHRELELLVASGLTPYEALAAATRNAGQVVARMGRDGNFGVIRVGNRADMVLLHHNPLENISHTRERIGVMVRGRWYLQEELNEQVEDWVALLREKE